MNTRPQNSKYLIVADLKELLKDLPDSATICVGDTEHLSVNVKAVYYDANTKVMYLEGWCQDVCESNPIWQREL